MNTNRKRGILIDKSFLSFHLQTLGFIFYYNGEFIPKYILYWNRYEPQQLIENKTEIKAFER